MQHDFKKKQVHFLFELSMADLSIQMQKFPKEHYLNCFRFILSYLIMLMFIVHGSYRFFKQDAR